MIIWFVVSTHLNKLSHIGNRPQFVLVKIKTIWVATTQMIVELDRQICFFRKPSRGNRWYISLPPARLEVNPIAPDLSPGRDPKRHGLCVWDYHKIKWPYMVEDYVYYIYKCISMKVFIGFYHEIATGSFQSSYSPPHLYGTETKLQQNRDDSTSISNLKRIGTCSCFQNLGLISTCLCQDVL